MPELILHKRAIRSVFQLLGERENDITYSVAWALAKSDGFSKKFLGAILGVEPGTTDLIIRIQVHEQTSGITDIEIEAPGQFFIIIEAKKGWSAPTRLQLETYARRKSFRDRPHLLRRIVPLSGCSPDFVLRRLACTEIDNVPVVPLTWQSVIECASSASSASHAEKRLLQELLIYLRGVISMQSNDSNWVYVVSLGSGTPPGWSVSWIDIIQRHSAYFHVIGSTWPKEPPNYIAFRYGGRLQSIHHIEAAESSRTHIRIFREFQTGSGNPTSCKDWALHSHRSIQSQWERYTQTAAFGACLILFSPPPPLPKLVIYPRKESTAHRGSCSKSAQRFA